MSIYLLTVIGSLDHMRSRYNLVSFSREEGKHFQQLGLDRGSRAVLSKLAKYANSSGQKEKAHTTKQPIADG